MSTTPDLFDAKPWAPEGLAYHDDVLSPAEERTCAERFATLPFAPFEFHGFVGERRIVSYGWRYDYGAERIRAVTPIPDFLLGLRERAAAVAHLAPEMLEQALVTEYAAGAAIGWHRDKPMFDEVIALSFLSACRLRLRRRTGRGWERHNIDVRPRSAYQLRGPVRRDWEHSILPVATLRYSVTFRRFRPGRAPPPVSGN